jgi:hypothetical protein
MGRYPKAVEATTEVLKAIGEGRLTDISKEEYDKLMGELQADREKKTTKIVIPIVKSEGAAKGVGEEKTEAKVEADKNEGEEPKTPPAAKTEKGEGEEKKASTK